MTAFSPPALLGWPRPPRPANLREPQLSQAVAHRLSWAGPAARTVWAPRLARLAEAAVGIELALVEAGELGAAMVTASRAGLPGVIAAAGRRGLAALPIEARTAIWEGCDHAATPEDVGVLIDVLVVAADRAEAAVDLLAGSDPAAVAAWFGHPPCCAAARALADGPADPVVAVLAGVSPQPVSAPAHLLLAGLGLGPLRHAPCSPGCAATAASIRRFVETGRRLGLDEEMGWLEEMGRWNVSWSLAGGVVEVKTAAFRYIHRADPGLRIAVRHEGDRSPDGAAPGLGFPFARNPPRALPASAVKPEPAVSAAPLAASGVAAGYGRGGFADPFAMRSRFCTAVWEQTPALRGGDGGVLHLTCADGLLLELAAEVNGRLVPHGVDADGELVERARRRHGRHGGNFQTGDWSDPALLRPLLDGGTFRLAFLDPEELLNLEPGRRAAVTGCLLSGCGAVVAVASDRALSRFSGIDGLATAAGLTLEAGRLERISARIVASGA